MTLVVDKFQSLIPPRSKSSPSGWTSFNAPCCHHRGHSPDKRKRAGVRFDGLGFVYNCFNCKFTTGWQPGSPIGEKLKTLCVWLGASNDDIKELIFEALKTESPEYTPQEHIPSIEFGDKKLPEDSMSIKDWLNSENLLDNDIAESISKVVDYLVSRGFDPLSDNFFWSRSSGYENRVIIPFRWQNRIVGNTARKIDDGKPKYLSDHHPHFVFNFDQQKEDQKYIFVCEGPFDALSINGVALLTNDVAEQQSRIINSLGVEVIVIPDQDRAGMSLINRASELGWSVAFPNWDHDIKDAADAVKRYGKLFVIVDAIKTSVNGSIRINIEKNKMLQKLSRIENE